ncbi:MAG: hypothetical protein ACRDZ8_18510 [Acidimicrobiales bacterium]
MLWFTGAVVVCVVGEVAAGVAADEGADVPATGAALVAELPPAAGALAPAAVEPAVEPCPADVVFNDSGLALGPDEHARPTALMPSAKAAIANLWPPV